MIIELILAALVLQGQVLGRITTSSSLTPDALSATWSLSGKYHLPPKNFSSSSLQQALRHAVSKLSRDSFNIGKLATIAIRDWKLPRVEENASFLKLVHNIIECALERDQIAHIQTNEGPILNIPGLIGMAPQWIRWPIDKAAQEDVSACLAARANFFETPPISLRGASLSVYADIDEEEQFSILQGQFWGNIFEEEPLVKSCWSSETALAWNQARVCATGNPVGIGHLSCGILTHLGHCKRFCEGGPESDAPYSIRTCEGNTHVIAVYLSEDNVIKDEQQAGQPQTTEAIGISTG